MEIQLNNIQFYHGPCLPKRPQATVSAASWKLAPPTCPASARPALTARPLPHSLPPKPPAFHGPAVPAPASGANAVRLPPVPGGASPPPETVAPRNVFDVELEKIHEAENTPLTADASAEKGCSNHSPNDIFPNLQQDLEIPDVGKRNIDHTIYALG